MLCALGTATFAAVALRTWSTPVAAVSLGVAVIWLTPAPNWTGLSVAFVASLMLVRPQSWFPAATLAGGLAGLWVSLLEAQGIPLIAALGVALAVPAASAWMSRTREGFAPGVLREEALLAVGGLGLLVAMLPDVLTGWQTASAMNLDPDGGQQAVMESWLVLAMVATALGGGVHALRSRR